MKKCPKCGAKTRITNSRAGDDLNHEHLVKEPRKEVGWYTLDFVVRSRACSKCSWKAPTVELSLKDLVDMMTEIKNGVDNSTHTDNFN